MLRASTGSLSRSISLLMVVLVSSLVLFGCGQQASPTAAPTKAPESKPAAAAPGAAAPTTASAAAGAAKAPAPTGKKYVAKAGLQPGPEEPGAKGLVYLGQEVAKRTNNEVEIQVFPSSQLGGEKDLNEGVRAGSIQIAWVSTGGMRDYQPKFQVISAPYLWDNWAQMRKVLDGPIGQEMGNELTQKTGMAVLDYWYYGPRALTTKTKGVKTPADIQGMKIRVPNFPIYLDALKAMGANPTAMDWKEVYSALQSGVVEGQENPLSVIDSSKLQEVQKYLSLTDHIFNPQIVIINNKWLQDLPAEYRKIVLEEAKKAGEYTAKIAMDDESQILARQAAAGVTVIKDVDKEAFRKATADVYKKYESDWGQGLYAKIQDAKK